MPETNPLFRGAPAQSLAVYRHKFLKHDIIYHDEIAVKKLERSAYYGGELRQFYVGKVAEPVFQVDVNSLYPYVMRGNQFPCKLLSFDVECNPLSLAKIGARNRCVAEVEIESDSVTYPHRNGPITAYAVGHYQTVLAGPELQYAALAGHAKAYRRFAVFDTAELFTEFIDEMIRLRKKYKAENNKSYESLCKLLCNSLYGKFGQKSFRWGHRPDLIASEKWARGIHRDLVNKTISVWRSIGESVFVQSEPHEITDSFPAISAWVCSYGRLYMKQIRDIAGEENVYYQCTDSLAVNKAGYEALLYSGYMSNDRIGGLRLIREGTAAEFRGPNNYTIGSEDVIAGIRKGSIRLNDKQFWTENFDRLESTVARPPNATIYSKQTIFESREYEKLLRTFGQGRLSPFRIAAPFESWQGSAASSVANDAAIASIKS